MNWNKIKEYQDFYKSVKEKATSLLEDNNNDWTIDSIPFYIELRVDMFKNDFSRELLSMFTQFILNHPKICRQDVDFIEFENYHKQWTNIEGFDINDQSHFNYLLSVVNERFKEIPFEFTSTHIKKYRTLSKFQRQVKRS
jgi:hypothetical protein